MVEPCGRTGGVRDEIGGITVILFVNACVREQSRTKRLADSLLSILQGTAEEVRLREIVFPAVDEAFLQRRERLIGEGKFEDPLFRYARQFSEASQIVIAAPYWDLSFPAALKQYLEQVSVPGITFTYTQDGLPKGLCAAERLFYVTTAGGLYVPEAYGFGYVEALCRDLFGIRQAELIRAAGLDLDGADAENILRESIREIIEHYGRR